ncbi:MAG TPA: ABC transporter permease, partial [Blastocatellia bacterium]|nr:ABC transporter permease [Blastocatellia bacterium]
ESSIHSSPAVVVLSHNCWMRKFGGDTAVVGKTVRLNGHPFTIIGVAPSTFPGMESFLDLEMYLPLGTADMLYPGSATLYTSRENTQFRSVARMQPGVDIEQARAALDVLARQLQDQYPATNRNVTFAAALESRARPMIEVADTFPRIAAVFMGLVGLVLLIACANVANLMLARASTRQKEIAVRIALGATRFRLVRLLLIESLMLGVIGGGAGLLFAVWATDWFSSIKISADAPLRFQAAPDWNVFAFSFVLALLAGVISGLVPALHMTRPDLNEMLKEEGRSSTGSSGRQRMRSLLVISQVAVSLLVLICAGLFIKSAGNAEKMELGFQSDNLLMFSVDVGVQGYERARGEQFFKQLAERVNTLPGVESATMSRNVPFGYNNSLYDIFIEERGSTPEDQKESLFATVVGQRFFETLGVPIQQGRDFTENDNEAAPKVAIINRAMAEKLWPGSDALGRRFRLEKDGPQVQVIGVAGDWQYLFLGEEPRPFFFLPAAQNYRDDMTFYLKTNRDAAAVAAAARTAVRELDSEIPVYDVKTMHSHLRDGRALLFVRLGATLATVFGVLAMTLSVIGLYGVISYTVAQRTHEIGIRMALGAGYRDVLRLIISKGLVLTLAGLAIGIGAALAITRVMSSLLYGVSPTDLATFVIIPVALAAVSLLASYIPARRATRVDPMVALRRE